MLQLNLGIAGTAKNTGKTTATAAILQELRLRGIKVSITSIGYDGEDTDNITGLPKPKLWVEPGDIVATAAKCVKASTASFALLAETQIATPLGKVIIGEVKKPGLAVTAGPNKRSDVKTLVELLSKIRPGVNIIDGALGRIAPMSETDGFVLATGAARTPNIVKLSDETGAFAKLANLPAAPQAATLWERAVAGVTVFDGQLGVIRSHPNSSLLTEQDIADMLSDLPFGDHQLYIPGILSFTALTAIKERYQAQPRRLFLTFRDPLKALMTGDPEELIAQFEELEDYGVLTGVLKRVPLIAVTVNPFFPEYRVEDNSYRKAFVDPLRLELALKARTELPVYNVVRHGAKGLVDAILLNQYRWESPMTMTF